MMATKTDITEYVAQLVGTDATELLSDEVVLSGMEDIIRKIEMLKPSELKQFEVYLNINNSPIKLHFVSPTLEVFCNEERAVRRGDKEHISNPYSLLFDSGSTTYWWVVGSNLYVYPIHPQKTYSVHSVEYGVDNGLLIWPDRYVYPLSLFCTMRTALLEARNSVNNINTDDLQTIEDLTITASWPELTLDIDLPSELDQSELVPDWPDTITITSGVDTILANMIAGISFADTTTRLSDDDIELANGEISKVRAQVEMYATELTSAIADNKNKIETYLGLLGAEVSRIKSILDIYTTQIAAESAEADLYLKEFSARLEAESLRIKYDLDLYAIKMSRLNMTIAALVAMIQKAGMLLAVYNEHKQFYTEYFGLMKAPEER